MAGCCQGGVEERWAKGVLAGFPAVLFEGFPGECDGISGI